jgi:hypothetical protein
MVVDHATRLAIQRFGNNRDCYQAAYVEVKNTRVKEERKRRGGKDLRACGMHDVF